MHIREKTNPGMLHQSQALELVSADNPQVGTKRDTDTTAGASAGGVAGIQPGRDEIPTPRDIHSVGASLVSKPSGEDTTSGGNPGNPVQRVFVLDKRKKPLDPTSPARARKLLKKRRARVHKLVPFTIRLTDRLLEDSVVHDHTIGIDPGSKTTGIALFRDTEVANTDTGELTTDRTGLFLMELNHRGSMVSKKLGQRANYRRGRRSRNLRYRAPRFDNRSRPKGWLPPSLQHRVDTTMTQVHRFQKLLPVTGIAYEAVRFDTQKLERPEITGVQYQQGELFGFEVREYLLTKYGNTCVYCDTTDTVLNLDHVVPRAAGGSNRVSNLVTSCIKCNHAKGKQPVEIFVTNRARLARIKRGLKQPLKDAAAVNATRNALHRALLTTGLEVQAFTGGRTKYNRTQLRIPKTHALDALCIGHIDTVTSYPAQTLDIIAMGRGSHQRTNVNKHGFAIGNPKTRAKRHFGFSTGDLVKAIVPKGKKVGTHVGRVAVRTTGSFNIRTATETIQSINHKYCHLLQRADGYAYYQEPTAIPHASQDSGVFTQTRRNLPIAQLR